MSGILLCKSQASNGFACPPAHIYLVSSVSKQPKTKPKTFSARIQHRTSHSGTAGKFIPRGGKTLDSHKYHHLPSLQGQACRVSETSRCQNPRSATAGDSDAMHCRPNRPVPDWRGQVYILVPPRPSEIRFGRWRRVPAGGCGECGPDRPAGRGSRLLMKRALWKLS